MIRLCQLPLNSRLGPVREGIETCQSQELLRKDLVFESNRPRPPLAEPQRTHHLSALVSKRQTPRASSELTVVGGPPWSESILGTWMTIYPGSCVVNGLGGMVVQQALKRAFPLLCCFSLLSVDCGHGPSLQCLSHFFQWPLLWVRLP